MNACQSLPAVLIVLATISSPLNGRRAYAQDSEPVKEQASNAQAIPGRDMIPGEEFNENLGADIASELAKSNPFVPATAPAEDTVNPELAPSKPLPAAQAIIPSENIQNPVIVPEQIATPVAEEVFVPSAPPAVTGVPKLQHKIFFDSPAPSQSDRRISKDKVAELRQQRALYQANQRMARMEYNRWLGREPLRPRWSPMPMMNSRYAPPTIVVPVFINPR